MTKKEYVLDTGSRRTGGGKFFVPLFKGLAYTLKNFFSKPVTIQYPTERREVSKRWRGLHRLVLDDGGDLKCVACGLCAKICPPQAISITPYEDEGGTIYPKEFVIDQLRCIFCGFCQEACPKYAIELTGVYDFVDYHREDFEFDITKLKIPERFIFQGK